VHAESLAETALDTVPHDRSADRAWHREPQAGGASRRVRARQAKRCE
jgi:hypothetical protein